MSFRSFICAALAAVLALAVVADAQVSNNDTLPEAAQLNTLQNQTDPTKPVYALIVNQVDIPSIVITYHRIMTCDGYNGTKELLSASLKSTLLGAGNFALLDEARFRRSRTGIKLAKNEKGPFLVSAMLTELGHRVEAKRTGAGNVRFDQDDSVGETALKAAAMVPLFWLGTLTALPTSWSKELEHGVLGLDILVTDPLTRQVITSFPVRGTFRSGRLEVGSRTGSTIHSTSVAESVMEGAIREACREAAHMLYVELQKRT